MKWENAKNIKIYSRFSPPLCSHSSSTVIRKFLLWSVLESDRREEELTKWTPFPEIRWQHGTVRTYFRFFWAGPQRVLVGVGRTWWCWIWFSTPGCCCTPSRRRVVSDVRRISTPPPWQHSLRFWCREEGSHWESSTAAGPCNPQTSKRPPASCDKSRRHLFYHMHMFC